MAVTMHDTTIVIVDTHAHTGASYTRFVLYCDQQGVVYKTAFSRGQHADYTMQAAGSVVVDQQHPYAAAVRAYCAGDSAALSTIPHQPRTAMTPFQRAVYQAMSRIPYGQVRSYKELAATAGYPGAARAVGTACKNNPLPLLVPCHRVVPATGGCGNYIYGTELKQQLLRIEGYSGSQLPL